MRRMTSVRPARADGRGCGASCRLASTTAPHGGVAEPAPATRTGWSARTSASGTAPAAEGTRVGPFAPDQCRWLIAPLLEAGLDLERIRTLVFRLGFQAVVDPGRDELVDVVRSEPAEVRAAWEAMLRRMLFLDEVTG